MSAVRCLFVLGVNDIYYGYGTRTFLKVPYSESTELARRYAEASYHATTVSENVLVFADLVVILGAVAGAVRPFRGAGWAILAFTVLSLVAVWLGTRADVALLHMYRR